MNRFLKKEWDNFEIPDSVLERSREAAWSRLEQPRRPAPFWVLAPGLATASVLLLLWLLWPAATPGIALDSPLASLPLERPAGDTIESVTVSPPAIPRPVGREPARRLLAEAKSPQTGEEAKPKRVVMNFRLPESGVRMIWISDDNFTFGGDE